MEDLASMINQVMQNPDAMRQLNDVAASLGLGGSSQPPPQGTPAAAPDLSSLFGALNGGNGGQSQQNTAQSSPQLDMKTLFMLQNALRTFSTDDQNTQLLRAMKPLLSAERAKKIDDAIKFLGLMKLLPLIKDSGLFSSK